MQRNVEGSLLPDFKAYDEATAAKALSRTSAAEHPEENKVGSGIDPHIPVQ